MAFETAKGTLVAPLATGNQDTTGLPFQPKAVLFWCSCQTAGAADTDVSMSCFGAATASTAQWAIGNAENGAASSNAGRAVRTDSCVLMPLNGNFATDGAASFVQFLATGFRLNWFDVPATANLVVHYLALGGSDLTNAKAEAHTIVRTTAGTEAHTGTGFQPDLVLFASAGVPNATSIIDATFCLGAARSPTQRWAQSFFENDAAASMQCWMWRSVTKCLVVPDATDVVDGIADISSLDADGHTLNWTDPVSTASSRVYYTLSLKGGQYAVGTDSSPNATGNQTETVGFAPTGVFYGWLPRELALDTPGTPAGDSGFGVGAVDSSLNEGHISISETDGDAVSQSWRGHDTATSIKARKGTRAAKGVTAAADTTALGATSFTLNWTTVDATVNIPFNWIAFGNAAAGGDVTVTVGAATATGSAAAPVVKATSAPSASTATGTTSAPTSLVSVGQAAALAVGSAQIPTRLVTTVPASGLAIGSAPTPTVAIGQFAFPAPAVALGSAPAPSVLTTVATPIVAAAGVAPAPSARVISLPASAVALGSVPAPTVLATPSVSAALSASATVAPLIRVTVGSPPTLAVAVTSQPVVQGGATASPAAATAAASTPSPTVVVASTPPAAGASGGTIAPSVRITLAPPASLAGASVSQPAATISQAATAASAAGSATQPAVLVTTLLLAARAVGSTGTATGVVGELVFVTSRFDQPQPAGALSSSPAAAAFDPPEPSGVAS